MALAIKHPPPDEPPPPPPPDDYTRETPEGVINLVETHDCFNTRIVVEDATVTGEQGATGSVPVRIDMEFLTGGTPMIRPLFGGQPVQEGYTDTLTLQRNTAFTLRFRAYDPDGMVEVTSDGDLLNVLTLRRGDRPSQFDPQNAPVPIGPALAPFIDATTGEVVIAANQVLYLVEFGSDRVERLHFVAGRRGNQNGTQLP